ncbi:uncharacterized protein LOC135684104 [Rhopilema esculentum]|uniref:uncharacterized protein LOC135684104 n=1 Tax=Rhopilema esculentum TaxID=499914 RepID=UPI0031D274F7
MGNLRNRTRKTSRKRKATSSFENIHKDEGKKQRNEAEAEPPTVAETTPSQGGEQPRPSNSEACSSTPLSRSSKKINKENENYYCEKENEDCGENSGFVLIDFAILSDVFSSLCCPVCKSLNLRLMELTGKRRGFAVTFCLICQGCAWEKEFVSSNSVTDKTKRSMEVNVRMIMAFRNIGCGLEAMNTYSMIMNMHKPMTQKNYNSLIDNLHVAYLEEAETCMKEAVEEVKEQSGSIDFTASFDGTWQKPGHASLNGVVTAVSNESGKVLDFEVKSKYCKACEKKNDFNKDSLAYLQWQIRHESRCSMNHKGSSGSMEVEGLQDIFKRSMEKYGIRYTTFIGDGYSSSFSTISKEKPYGADIEISKKECIGHVQKRLGTRLRKLKSSCGKKKLKDGKGIGGKGRLTEKMINKMQNYYGLAIRHNKNNLQGMMNDIKAGLYHLASSDSHPQHNLCPVGKQSWCTWQKNKADGKTGYKHKSYLPSAIVDVVLPIYDDLSDKSLLTSCLDSFTQNPNESLNKLIWARCPKKIYQGRKVVELCTASAATHFNDGASSIARVLQRFHICPGKQTNFAIQACDRKRITFAERKASYKEKNRRKKLRAIKKGFVGP